MKAEYTGGILFGTIWGTATKLLDIPSLASGLAFVASTLLAGFLGALGAHIFKMILNKKRK